MSAGWSLVGERGPELSYMPKGASVVPLDRLGDHGMTAGPRGGGTEIIQVLLDGRVIGQTMRDYAYDKARGNGSSGFNGRRG
jgi:hypothetical protein